MSDTVTLESERDFLLRSLDDLDAERAAGNVDDETYQQLYDDYTARAAAVIRALRDGVDTRPTAAPVSAKRRVLTLSGIAVFATVAALALTYALGARLPGQSVTGNNQVSNAESQQTLSQAVRDKPNDVQAHLAYARFLDAKGNTLNALKQYDAALELQATNEEALAYSGWLLFRVGTATPDNQQANELLDSSLARLRQATEADPNYADAHFFLGAVLFRGQSNPGAALPELQQYLVLAPNSPLAEQVRKLLAQVQAELDSSTTTTISSISGP